MTLLQTTAALNTGNSGGALINDMGQVIGITNMKLMAYNSTVEGLGFAIPSRDGQDRGGRSDRLRCGKGAAHAGDHCPASHRGRENRTKPGPRPLGGAGGGEVRCLDPGHPHRRCAAVRQWGGAVGERRPAGAEKRSGCGGRPSSFASGGKGRPWISRWSWWNSTAWNKRGSGPGSSSGAAVFLRRSSGEGQVPLLNPPQPPGPQTQGPAEYGGEDEADRPAPPSQRR